MPFPLVLLGERIFDGPTDHVTMHNVGAARAATEHLLAIGRRRIAVIERTQPIRTTSGRRTFACGGTGRR